MTELIEQGEEWVLTRMTPEEIQTLARRHVTNEVFLTNDPAAVEASFGMILGLWVNRDEEFVHQIGAVWEEYAKAGPRSINGYPFFTSMHVVHRDDLPALDAQITAMRDALGLRDDDGD